MTSTTSWFKEFSAVFKFSAKDRLSTTIVHTIILFFALPFVAIFVFQNEAAQHSYTFYNALSDYLQIIFPLFIIPSMLVFVMISAAALYKYMHSKRSTDLFHSFPVRRAPMLLGRCAAGILSVTVPMIINTVLLYGVCLLFSASSAQCVLLLLRNCGIYLLFAAAVFSFATLLAVVSGTTAGMFVSGIIITIVWPLMIIISEATISFILSGYSARISVLLISALSPSVAAFMPFTVPFLSGMFGVSFAVNTLGVSFYIWWGAALIAMLAAAVFAYCKRKSETAENIMAFPVGKNLIRLFATYSASLAFGLLFYAIFDSSVSFFLGIIFASVITHIIIEALYMHTLKNLGKSFKWYAAAILSVAVFLSVCSTGCFGYDIKVPNADSIESISVDMPYSLTYDTAGNLYLGQTYSFYKNDSDKNSELLLTTGVKYKTEEEIAMITELHKSLCDLNRKYIYPYTIESVGRNSSSCIFTYKLKNGKVFVRKVAFNYEKYGTTPEYGEFKGLVAEMSKINGFFEQQNIANYLSPSYISQITISGTWSAENLNASEEQKEELLKALASDSRELIIYQRTESVFNISFELNRTFDVKEGDPLQILTGYTGKASCAYNWADFSISKDCKNTMALAEKYGWDIDSLNQDSYGYQNDAESEKYGY